MSEVIPPQRDSGHADAEGKAAPLTRCSSPGTNRPSISSYLLALILAIALPFSGLIGYSIWRDFQVTRDERLQLAQRRAELVAADIGRFVADARTMLQQLAKRDKVRSADPEACDPILAEFKALMPTMANVAIADRDGAVVCSALAKSERASVADAAWFHEIRRQNRFLAGEPHLGPVSGKWVAVLAQPLTDGNGGFNGAIGFPINLAQFKPPPMERITAFGATATLVSGRGTVMTRTGNVGQWIGKAYPASRLLPGSEVASGRLVASDPDNRFVGFANVEGTDWRVVVETDALTELEALRRHGGLELLGALFLLATGVMMALRIGHYIARPVREIAQAAKRVAEGDFSRRAQVRGPAEIEAVTEQFNAMLDVRLRAEHKYRSLLESAADPVIVSDRQGRIVLVNQQAEACFGYGRDEMIGQPIDILLPEDVRERHGQHVRSFGEQPQHRQMGRFLRARRRDGSTFPVDISLTPLQTDEDLLVSAIVRDLSERHNYEEQLAYLSQYDPLTGLPNRLLLRDRLSQALNRGERDAAQLALIHLDIDGFKEFNDAYGTALADRVLQHCAEQIRKCIREADTVARTGSDEFIVIMEDLPRESVAQLFGERLKAHLAGGVEWEGRKMPVSASIGIAMFPQDGHDAEALLKCSDLALVQARAEGGGALSFFESEMDARAGQRREILSHLHGALERGELSLHYQPQVETRSGRIIGVETLLRWHSPELGSVSPAKFIPLAEESGLIDKIGDWVLRTACEQNRAWQKRGLPPLVVAVNLSARQFRADRLEAYVKEVLRDTGLAPGCLELEITEGMLMQDPKRAADMLARLYEMGVKIAVDDFGTGYSSLSYLKRFKVSTLKVDQSFVRDLSSDADDAAIVSAVVSLAHSLRLGVIAEGVETEAQRLFLEELGCQQCQGYLFCKPVPPEEIERMLLGIPQALEQGIGWIYAPVA